MTRKSVHLQQQRPSARRRDIFLPHSSWARVPRGPAGDAVIVPEDFWARLGL